MDARGIVGRNIKRLRLTRGMSQTEFANHISSEADSFSQAYVSQLEHGQRNISLDKLAMIAEALEVRLSELVVED